MTSPQPDRIPVRDSELKYAKGEMARASRSQARLQPLEQITLVHVSVLLIGTTWAFGGQADAVRAPIVWWASLSILITLSAIQRRDSWREDAMRPLVWLWPLLAFNAFVLLGALNPSFREVLIEGETLLVNQGGRAGFPSSARPMLGLQSLWLFDALWLTCFNVALILRKRRMVRMILIVAVSNAGALAVFGTVQKLSHAKGLYFDAVKSPQVLFFASFIYHNHWGAFTLLMMSACLALTWHYSRRREARDFFHTPAFAGLVLLLGLAITVPLSGSRSSTLLAITLLAAALIHWIVRMIQARRRFRESIAPPLLGAAAALVLVSSAIWYVAKDTIVARFEKTQEQVADMRARGGIGDRILLYHNTWRMAKDKLWFGWGMASYPHVFRIYNTRESKTDGLPVFYNDAHSDWLQSFAEHGLAGSALLALTAVVPLSGLRRRHFTSQVGNYLFGGCVLLLLYAWFEFPFGNIAVVLSWWLCFFCAVQYARLQDRESTSGALLAPASS